ncbi:unnamed protein product [Mytilus edulis]|uniref:RING-type domain-containing protein n=1 Tax=Mytilus edulis TaxID=6550 RepID=A0A8S3S7M2_MYTED|nr:unnamed protein product [Mytilus edulis]
MATSLNVNEIVEHTQEDFADLLTCTICLETFKQPKYLPCLHTFRETCINTYIVSTVKGEKSEGFKCPVCRRLVPIRENLENLETWAKSLPGNHFVVSMIDRKAMKKAEKLCDACSSKKCLSEGNSLVLGLKCEQVITIDKAVSGVKESTKAKELTKKLKETSHKLEEIIQNRNLNITNFEIEIDVILVEIENKRKKLNEKLDKLENKIRKKNGNNCIELESAGGKGFQYNLGNSDRSFNQEIDQDGNVYVVGYDSNNIHQLTPTGQFIRIIPLSDIDNTVTSPWVLRFKRNTNRFLLTFNSSRDPVLVCEIE